MPVQLNNPIERPFSEIDFVGLAIRRGNPYVHVGFLYRNDDDQVCLSDLARHHIFRGSTDPDTSYFWLEPQFNDIVRELVATFLMHVAEQNKTGEIPYSTLRQGQAIDKSGKYVSSGMGTGLTCATYILSVFEALEIPLLVLESWPVGRPRDLEWAQSILAMLENVAPKEHIEAQKVNLPNVVRYRPEEVGAAFTMFTNTPLSFEQVKPDSEELLGLLTPAPPAQARA